MENMKTMKCVILTLLTLVIGAQFLSAQGMTPKDTVNVRDKHKLRQASYEALQEPFPTPRRNNWSIGIQKGLAFVGGDVRPERGLGVGINARRALGHFLSLRGQLSTGYARGLNWRANGGFVENDGLNGTNDAAANYLPNNPLVNYEFVFHNFRMRYWESNIQGVFNLGNISFYNKEPRVNIFGFAGVGGMLYRTDIDALDEDGQIYDYSGIPATEDPAVRQDALNSLHNLLDGEFETRAEYHQHKPEFANRTLIPTATLGLGIAFKMSRRVSLAIEHRATWTGDDLLDGQRWEETNTLTANPDYLQFTTIGINFRLGKGEESLWWENPMKQLYSDVRDLKRFNNSDFKDSDKDGVPNDRDKEPNSPEGVSVDSQGRALDSDGDGIPDFKDKEPFTPKGAEVNKSGIAMDSDNDGVIDLFDEEPNTPADAQADSKGRTIKGGSGGPATTVMRELASVHFDLGKDRIKEDFLPGLYWVARNMHADKALRVRVVGHADVRGQDRDNYDLSKRRAEAVVKVLSEHFGVEKDRIFIEYKGSDEQAIKGLPGVYDEANESLHYLNRRVELFWVE